MQCAIFGYSDYNVNLQHELLNYKPKRYRDLKDDAVLSQNLFQSGVSSMPSTSACNRKLLHEKREKAQLINEILLTSNDTVKEPEIASNGVDSIVFVYPPVKKWGYTKKERKEEGNYGR
ncbi:hypothetical protein ABEB36_010603 [Hypothenemus hampei]|uniref:Uncharacterized protein n=1 Tax=Hypothenemus hampei TaxID=57062 RepID=A0ABD1ECG4_HYPHA